MHDSRTNEQNLNESPNTNGSIPSPSSQGFLLRASALLMGATLISRLLGLVREMLVARYYGATGQTDSFAFALVVPELLRTLMVSGAVASVFVPLMTETQKSGKVDEAKHLAGLMITFITFIAIAVVLAGEISAPWLVKLSEVIRLSQDGLSEEKIALTTGLIRIMLPTVVFIGLWGLMGGILNTYDNFHVPGLAPIAWNGTIIALLIIFGAQGKIQHVAWAFMIGHVVQMLIHFPWLWKLGIKPEKIDWHHPMLRRFLELAPAAILAYAAPAVNAFIGQGMALNLQEKAASSLMYAFRIQQLPLSVFGVSVATALFPTLSRHASKGEGKELVRSLATGLRMTSLAVIPAVVLFLVLPEQIIELILQRGRFNAQDTARVAVALYWYSWAILPMSLLLLTARTFFSEKDTKTPAFLGIATIGTFYVLAMFLSAPSRFGFYGLAMSNSVISWIFLFISLAILHRRHKKEVSLFRAVGLMGPMHMVIAGVVEALVLIGFSALLGEVHGTMHLLGYMAGASVIGAGVYLGILKIFGNHDLSATVRKFARK
ncbi:MAG: murein biosynthesis integral membrane protein MurJ [bacterium]|nr:murein biosynthesis integral membrane protein MurJ [bacterium]